MNSTTTNTTATTTINTDTKNFLKAINYANKFVATEGDFKGQVTISGRDGLLTIKATDNVETVSVKNISFTSNDMTIDSFNAISLECKKLLKVLKALKGDNVSLEISTNKVVVKSNRSKIKLDLFDIVQDIEIESEKVDAIILELNETLIDGFNQIAHAIDNNNPRFELNGALLKVSNNTMQIVATDTKRLPISKTDVISEDFEVILPKRGVSSIIDLFVGYKKTNNKLNLVASIQDDRIVIATENISYSVKLINSTFPEFEKIVPRSINREATISRALLLEMVQEASVLDEELVVNVTNNAITLCDMLGDTEVSEELELNTEFRFGINAKNFTDFLNSTTDDAISIGFNEPSLPIVLSSTSGDYKEVLMPIVMTEEVSHVA